LYSITSITNKKKKMRKNIIISLFTFSIVYLHFYYLH